MFTFLGTTRTSYLVGAGVVTTTAVAGRGLVRSVRLVAQGQYGEAGLQALAALATPAALAQTAAAELFVDVIDAARELSGPTLDAGQPKLHVDKAA
jgi:hypothetical protein